jgi:hypothetical protein
MKNSTTDFSFEDLHVGDVLLTRCGYTATVFKMYKTCFITRVRYDEKYCLKCTHNKNGVYKGRNKDYDIVSKKPKI